jgi:hypothetical protein
MPRPPRVPGQLPLLREQDRDDRVRSVLKERKGRPKKLKPEQLQVPSVEQLAQALWDVAGDFGVGELMDHLGLEPERAAEVEDLCNLLACLCKARLLKLEMNDAQDQPDSRNRKGGR